MSETRFAANDALTVNQWARRLAYDTIYRTEISPLIGTDSNSIIHLKTETQKDAGDKITFGLRKKLTGDGFTEQEPAEGSGESLSLYSDSVTINELGHVVNIPSKGRSIDAQRVPFNLRSEARMGLKDWWEERLSVMFFNQICGYTPEARPKYFGFNTPLKPTRHIWVDAGNNNSDGDENLASDDIFSLKYIDYAVEMAKTAASPIRPINVKGEGGGQDIAGGKYVMYLHPHQVTDLRNDTGSGQWQDIQLAAMKGGEVSKNPIFTGALGMYNNVILKEANHITLGADNTTTGTSVANVRRAVLLGAQAVAIAFSKGGSASTMNWNEELLDHKRRLEVSTLSMLGMKKTKFDSADFGTVVVSSYAAAHT